MTNLDAFDFDLPAARIASEPARPRDAARLLHVAPSGLADHRVRDLPTLLRAGDLLVVNDTRVIPAQLRATRGQARVGLTLDRPLADGGWVALARNARRLRPGDEVAIEGAVGFSARIRARHADGSVVLDFDRAGAALDAALRMAGTLALPPYIPRPEGPTACDQGDYQTMFAAHDGAVAAPTAGLHMTPALLAALQARGVGVARLTLHVGAGTFLPLREDSLSARRLHPERGTIAADTAAAINAARAAGGRIVALGTTTLRLLESAVDPAGRILPVAGETDIMLAPGHVFRSADVLMTNFHLPRSSLFVLVCAFAGTERMRAAYAHAIATGYRFYSYGDATLLERAA
ncbi:MAG: tRNA preQ1(34) S-adenosylmethionine ribosyltransferase-isomerase QueA [Rhodospirillales bacterium]|nr:tRNA preQ1(34) S-adenosylmethionine ribosyltransferase-isomerase QueA [Rhodospirillales bacterium]